jgi:hypothetical protein
MQHRFQRASLAPDGFIVDGVKVVAEGVQILLRSRQPLGTCPDCGALLRNKVMDSPEESDVIDGGDAETDPTEISNDQLARI